MRKVIKLTESDITKIVKKLVTEAESDRSMKYYKLYQEYKNIDGKLAEILNTLHNSYGLGVDSEDEFMKYMAEKGHKMTSLLRKAKELSNKVVKDKYEELKTIVNQSQQPKI